MAPRRICEVMTACARLKCPRCGRGPMFSGLFKMRAECPQCRLRFEREQGFFVGAIYLNYGVTVAIAVAGFFLLDSHAALSPVEQVALWGAFAVVFPLFFFRYSRSFWLAIVYIFVPDEMASHRVVKR